MVALASLMGAVFSTITTVYFWFVRARGERPDLRCELVERELFLGAGAADRRQVGLKVSLVAANYSSLPNAVLAVKLWVKQREGTWLEAEKVSFDKTTPRPFNIPALQTALLNVNGTLTFPAVSELEQGGSKALVAYADRFLASPREIRVELKGLNEQRFTSIVSYDAGP
ncbi:MAG: hypothetical protein L0Z62_13920 [Gemmataceae bacterium]|nr:hypothetical protein [Gemmataceae bacterium]